MAEQHQGARSHDEQLRASDEHVSARLDEPTAKYGTLHNTDDRLSARCAELEQTMAQLVDWLSARCAELEQTVAQLVEELRAKQVAYESMSARCAELEQTVAELFEQRRAAQAEHERLSARCKRLELELAVARAQLRKDSTNSSKPPSSDSVFRKGSRRTVGEQGGEAAQQGPEQRRRKRRRRKRRTGARRNTLDAITDVERVEVWPHQCGRCGAPLAQHGRPARKRKPKRHRVFDWKDRGFKVFEYVLYRVYCRRCGAMTRAKPPAEHNAGCVGPGAVAVWAIWLTAGMSWRDVQEVTAELGGWRPSLGTIANALRRACEVLDEPMQQIVERIDQAEVVHVDETPWFVGNRLSWLWVATAAGATWYMVTTHRDTAAAWQLLGRNDERVLVTDRYVVYDRVHGGQRQLCVAHLTRTLRSIEQGADRVAALAAELLGRCVGRMMSAWHACKRGEISYAQLERDVATYRQEFVELCQQAAECCEASSARKLTKLADSAESFTTFASQPGVEPTNNAAERALRPLVLWRKRSFGTQSQWGTWLVTGLMSIRETLRQQGRRLFGWLRDALIAHATGSDLPRVLPVAA